MVYYKRLCARFLTGLISIRVVLSGSGFRKENSCRLLGGCFEKPCSSAPTALSSFPRPLRLLSRPRYRRTSPSGSAPYALLNSGGTAFYTAGNGTSTLEFLYTVEEGDSSAALDVAVVSDDVTATVAVSLPVNSSIFDANNVESSAVVTLPKPGFRGNWGDQANIVIDTE